MSVKIHVIGRLGADAEVKETKQGKKFSTFNVAVDDFVQGKKTTTWFAVADFSEVAVNRAEYLKKGALVEVQGLECVRPYLDRNNLPNVARDIRATHIDFVSFGNKQEKEGENVDCGTLKPTSTTETEPKQQEKEVVVPQVTSSASSSIIDDLPF